MDKEDKIIIIGLSGKIGSGKDYIAKEIIGNYLKEKRIGYIHMAFSDAIKVHLMVSESIPYEKLFIKKSIETRKKLQNLGMEMRENNDKIWIKYLDSWMKVYENRGIKVVLISDVRFNNENDYIKEKGGMVFRIIAPNRTLKKVKEESENNNEEINKIKNHISEIELNDNDIDKYDEIIYNDNEDHENKYENIFKKINMKI